jgi:hypothetical protein
LITILNGVDTDTFRPRSLSEKVELRWRLGLREAGLLTVCRDSIKNLEFI